jgi:AraC family transcriptional regulator
MRSLLDRSSAIPTTAPGTKHLQPPLPNQFDRIVFESGLVRIGAFRCHPSHPDFQDTGPASNCCFVFPRTAVQIEHEHEPPFVANPNVVTFYNSGQQYERKAISPDGDRCDWFGIAPTLVRDAARTFDTRVDDRPERPFGLTRGSSSSSTYLLQRNLYRQVTTGKIESLEVEETVIELLDQVLRSAYSTSRPHSVSEISSRQRATVRDIETILSVCPEEPMSLRKIAHELDFSAYHMCRLFRRVTGTKLHQYRLRLRLRVALANVLESEQALTDIALEMGFSSHSHFTSAFHREFGITPSWLRSVRPGRSSISNFLIAPLDGVRVHMEGDDLRPN